MSDITLFVRVDINYQKMSKPLLFHIFFALLAISCLASKDKYVRVKSNDPCSEVDNRNLEEWTARSNYETSWGSYETYECHNSWKGVSLKRLEHLKACPSIINRGRRDLMERGFDLTVTAISNLIDVFSNTGDTTMEEFDNLRPEFDQFKNEFNLQKSINKSFLTFLVSLSPSLSYRDYLGHMVGDMSSVNFAGVLAKASIIAKGACLEEVLELC